MKENLKFIWERVKEKKIVHGVIILALLLIWLPNSIQDLITIPFLISLIGFKVYLSIAFVLIAAAIIFLNGKLGRIKSLLKRPKRQEIKKICKKMHKNENAVNKCIKNQVIKNFENDNKRN